MILKSRDFKTLIPKIRALEWMILQSHTNTIKSIPSAIKYIAMDEWGRIDIGTEESNGKGRGV